MKWSTQVGKFTTNAKGKVDFFIGIHFNKNSDK